jgi:cob(I)alamin adenosyltransferase
MPMGHRLSKIVTRTGDAGETGLADGSRLAKSSPRVQALGDVDELNCQIGVLLTQDLPDELQTSLSRVQNELFDLGGELSLPGANVITEPYLERLEAGLTLLNAGLPPLKEFILPGGNPPAAVAHVARAIARRAERSVWALNAVEPLNPLAPRYLNRLSDYLFVSARVLARRHGGQEPAWQRGSA